MNDAGKMSDYEKAMTPEEFRLHREKIERSKAGSISAKLADAEQASVDIRAKELMEVSDLIDDILRRHEVTWGEFQNIIDAYSNRTFVALNGMTIKSLKHHYDNPIIRIRESKTG